MAFLIFPSFPKPVSIIPTPGIQPGAGCDETLWELPVELRKCSFIQRAFNRTRAFIFIYKAWCFSHAWCCFFPSKDDPYLFACGDGVFLGSVMSTGVWSVSQCWELFLSPQKPFSHFLPFSHPSGPTQPLPGSFMGSPGELWWQRLVCYKYLRNYRWKLRNFLAELIEESWWLIMGRDSLQGHFQVLLKNHLSLSQE